MILESLVLPGAWFASLGLLLGVIYLRKWRIDRQKLRMPVAEKLLRGPGESLQKKLEELEDQLSTELAMAFVVPLMCISLYLLERRTSTGAATGIGLAVVGSTALALICRQMFRLLDKKRNYRLGLLGERAVGEELNQLMLMSKPVTLITRLRLDAALYAPAPTRAAQRGRPRCKGRRLPTLAQRLREPDTVWSRVRVRWYGGAWRWLEVASDQAVWYHSGLPPVALRWVLIRDPKGRREPQALLSTDTRLPASEILGRFVRRWAMEVTFQEARAHLGIEGQRQWNDLAIARTTPLRLALFSLVTLLVHRQPDWQASVRQAAWYKKALPTFSDALAQVRRCLWQQMAFCMLQDQTDSRKPSAALFEHLGEMLAYAA